ncbi:MAG: Acot [Frankiales bacterium]|nr:Acot [Frankiales bacterium]
MSGSHRRKASDIFTELLDLKPLSDDGVVARFQAQLPPPLSDHGRFFGGAHLALITRAAMLSVDDDRQPHALQNLFVSAGDAPEPVELEVRRDYDGGSFSSRSVTVTQGGKLLCHAQLSLQRPEELNDVSLPILAGLPGPDSGFARNPVLEGAAITSAFDLREFEVSPFATGSSHDVSRMMWAKLITEERDLDPELRPCVLAYMSDFGATIGARVIVGATLKTPGRFASLNHSFWWHRDLRPADWTLIEFRPITAISSRGLVSGAIHSQDGRHLATITQEALMRITPPPSEA